MSSNPQIRRSEAILCPIASNDDIRTAAVESLAQIIPVSPFITGIVLTNLSLQDYHKVILYVECQSLFLYRIFNCEKTNTDGIG